MLFNCKPPTIKLLYIFDVCPKASDRRRKHLRAVHGRWGWWSSVMGPVRTSVLWWTLSCCSLPAWINLQKALICSSKCSKPQPTGRPWYQQLDYRNVLPFLLWGSSLWRLTVLSFEATWSFTIEKSWANHRCLTVISPRYTMKKIYEVVFNQKP